MSEIVFFDLGKLKEKDPFALGGLGTLENFQLLCRKCNLKEGAKP